MTMLAVVLVVGLALGGGIGYFLFSGGGGDGETIVETVEQHPFKDKVVDIGYISSSASGLETTAPFLEDLTLPDINEYMSKLGYGVSFNFLIDQAESQAAIHLEKVQSFKSIGVTCFLGGPWSSMASASLSYVNENDMLMVSSSSTSPLLAIPDDRLYRTCPTDYVQAPAMAEMHETWGIDALIVIHRGDSWGDGIFNLLEEEWLGRGKVILERIRYSDQASEFANYLSTMNDVIRNAADEYGYEHIGVQTMSFSEEVTIVTQTQDYPETRKVIWMGAESSGRSQRMLDDSGGLCVQLRVFSSYMAPAVSSWKWQSLEDRYYDMLELNAGFYTGADYDAAHCLAIAMIACASDAANDVVEVFGDTARNFYGSTGWVDLDENGDRKPTVFDIWGYYERDGETGFQVYGMYDGTIIEVNWWDEVLAEQGLVRPSLAE
jgi:branched-chain amino acid transport system substrate-binding protein